MSESQQRARTESPAQRAVPDGVGIHAFRDPDDALGRVDACAASNLVAASNDLTLAVDADGQVCDVAFGDAGLAAWRSVAKKRWLGRRWSDIVTVESRTKVDEMLSNARNERASRWRQINFPANDGPDLPVLCRAVPAGDDRVVVLGRDLSHLADVQQRLMDAQLQVERDFARRRQLETRYRLLFQVSFEPIIIVDAGSNKVVEANPAAGRLLGSTPEKLVGRAFPEGFDAGGTRAINALLAGVHASGRTDQAQARHKRTDTGVTLTASMFRQESGPLFLVQLQATDPARDADVGGEALTARVVAQGPDGFVVTDPAGNIIAANQAFLHLAQIANEDTARGETLDRWIGRPGADFALLLGSLREHGSVARFPTALRCEFGSMVDVELAGVALPQSEPPCLGFTIRNVGSRAVNGEGSRAIRALPRSVDQLTDLVGRVKLKELVRESTDMVERLCIEAALELSGDNRSSAAEILGLSRQSLYVKLRRYGLGDLDTVDDG